MEYEIVKELFSPCAGDAFPLNTEIVEQYVADPEAYVRAVYAREKEWTLACTEKDDGSLVLEARLISGAKHRYTFTPL